MPNAEEGFVFFSDSDKPNLKSIFDNIRNYIICGTLFAISIWLRRIPAELFVPDKPGQHDAYYLSRFGSYSFLAIGIVLTLFNVIQTYMIIIPSLYKIQEWFEKRAKVSPRWESIGMHDNEVFSSFGVLVSFYVLFLLLILIRAFYLSTSVFKRSG
jgi:hypothetical protein